MRTAKRFVILELCCLERSKGAKTLRACSGRVEEPPLPGFSVQGFSVKKNTVGIAWCAWRFLSSHFWGGGEPKGVFRVVWLFVFFCFLGAGSWFMECWPGVLGNGIYLLVLLVVEFGDLKEGVLRNVWWAIAYIILIAFNLRQIVEFPLGISIGVC